MGVDEMHNAGQGLLIGQVSAEAPAVTAKIADNELDIQMIVMATVARAVAAGAIEAALRFPPNPAAPAGATVSTQSAMGQLHDAPNSVLKAPTSATVDALKC